VDTLDSDFIEQFDHEFEEMIDALDPEETYNERQEIRSNLY
jgi:hypothetical protein